MSLLFSANALYAQFAYVFPKNGSVNNFPSPFIILRNGAMMDPSSVGVEKVTLTGSKSGEVPAHVVLSTDGKTVCITPAVPFAFNEQVTVKVKDGLRTINGEQLSGTEFKFSVRRDMTPEEKAILTEYLATHDDDGNPLVDPNQQSTYVPYENSAASTRGTPLGFMNIYVNNSPTPGQLFFHRNSGAQPTTSVGIGYGIMESNGDSVFYRASTTDGENFRVNLNGSLTAYRLQENIDTAVIVLDSNYNIVDTIYAGDGPYVTQHEHLFFPDGTKWFTIYDWQGGWDLSQYGGSDQATVNVSWIQQLDADNNVIYQWRSDEHFVITDAAFDISLLTQTVDPWHVNALVIEPDGKIIASFRNMDEVTKIDPVLDDVIWRWGGENNEFTVTGDPDGKFSHQHHVQRLPNGNILMFDNGNLHTTPISKPKEYVLDENAKTANCIWFYTHPQVNGFNMFTKNQGSVVRLSNGNTLIGYGLPNIQGLPNGTEIDVNKNIIWEWRFKDSTEYTYRLYKYDWNTNVGIADLDVSQNMEVFPNPGNGLFTLEFNAPVAEKVTIEVVNLLGQTVYSNTEFFGTGKQSTELDLSELDKGFYFIQVTTGKLKLASQILIQ